MAQQGSFRLLLLLGAYALRITQGFDVADDADAPGVNFGVVPFIPSSHGTCGCDLDFTRPDTNNLGGRGPKMGAPVIAYEGACTRGDAVNYRMIIEVEKDSGIAGDSYQTLNSALNGQAAHAPYGRVSVQFGTRVGLKARFLNAEDQEVEVPSFFFSVLDLDLAGDHQEQVEIHGFDRLVSGAGARVIMQKAVDSTVFRSSGAGPDVPSPADPLNLNAEQASVAVSVLFVNVRSFRFSLQVLGPQEPKTHSFLIAGTTSLSKDCVAVERSVIAAPPANGAAEHYNCNADISQRQSWTPRQRMWCCTHEEIGCRIYKCLSDERTWNSDQVSWCCKNKNKGCPLAAPVVLPPRPAPVALPARVEPFNCFVDKENEWTMDRKGWCCRVHHKACNLLHPVAPKVPVHVPAPPPAFPVLPPKPAGPLEFDCEAGAYIWQEDWSDEKKAWCCKRSGGHGPGCSKLASTVQTVSAGEWQADTYTAARAPVTFEPVPFVAALPPTRAPRHYGPFHCSTKSTASANLADKGLFVASWRTTGLNQTYGWSLQESEWCCAAKGVGCQKIFCDPNRDYGAVTSWSAQKLNWCCATVNVGCPGEATARATDTEMQTATEELAPSKGKALNCLALVGVSQAILETLDQPAVEWCCHKQKVGCEFHCNTAELSSWSTEKKDYCCKNKHIGCAIHQEARESEQDERIMRDCNYELDSWKARWPLKKSLWCCANWDKGCYDCRAPTPWTHMHRDFCCQGRLEGCDAPVFDEMEAIGPIGGNGGIHKIGYIPIGGNGGVHTHVAELPVPEPVKTVSANLGGSLAWVEAEKQHLKEQAVSDESKLLSDLTAKLEAEKRLQLPAVKELQPPPVAHNIEESESGNTVAGYWLWVEGEVTLGKGTLPAAPLTPSEWAEDKWGDNLERQEQKKKEEEEEKKKAPGHWLWKGPEWACPKFPPSRPTMAEVTSGKSITKVYNSDVCSETTPMKRSHGLRIFCCRNYNDGCDNSAEAVGAPALESHTEHAVRAEAAPPAPLSSTGRWVWKAAEPKPFVPPWYAPWETETSEAKKARIAAAGMGKWEWTGPQNVPHPGPPASIAPQISWPQIKAEINHESYTVMPSSLSTVTFGLLILGVLGGWIALRRRPSQTSMLQVDSWAGPELE